MLLTTLTLGVGLVCGYILPHVFSLHTAQAQAPTQTEQALQLLVQGHGRAISVLKPPGETITLSAANAPLESFNSVPAGQKFVLTDVMYVTQASVKQKLVVNIADADLEKGAHGILFQTWLAPGRSEQVHLCSGYVIPAGHALVAFTNAGLEPAQYVSISVTGYLTAE